MAVKACLNAHLAAVQAGVLSTAFHPSGTYSWLGQRSPGVPRRIRDAMSAESKRELLHFDLQLRLYSDCYCQGAVGPQRVEPPGLPPAGRSSFVDLLSKANVGEGYSDDGWEFIGTEGAKVILYRNGLRIHTVPRERRSKGAEASGPTSLHLSKESLGLSPGFYLAMSDVRLDLEERAVRIYMNIVADGAELLVRLATSILNAERVPFRLKVLSDSERYTRCDAAVLYIRKQEYQALSKTLIELYANISDYLRSAATPLFTKELAPGLGLAEDPGHGESFGLHRCGLWADGMIQAHELRKKSIPERMEVVEAQFAAAGVSLEAPYLRPNSEDVYEFPAKARPASVWKEPRADSFLQVAADIGRRIVSEAVWHREVCNWVGIAPRLSDIGGPSMACGTLGPDLYNGSSGIGLFLASLYTATGDDTFRATAIGATRHALGRIGDLSSAGRAGLYTGCVGIALAAAWVGTILDESELIGYSDQVFRDLGNVLPEKSEHDLLSGGGGTIVGLLALRQLLGRPDLLNLAEQVGNTLVDTAEISQRGCSWKSPEICHGQNLTGFSHGAAGIGYGLLELFLATDNVKYRATADLAFGYERSCFDAAAEEWPDFRQAPRRGSRGRRPMTFTTTWCHGGPGIALSRLRAYSRLGDEIYRHEASVALNSTRKKVEAWLADRAAGNFSYCHGLCGNAEVLSHGCQILGQEAEAHNALASAVAARGIEAYAAPRRPWPCGAAAGDTPGLMLGRAGIGYFYLRQFRPSLPSLLAIRPEDFASPASAVLAEVR
jgi:hypothetical protein